MSKTTCSVTDCTSPVRSRMLCGKHYDRVRRTGSTDLMVIAQQECAAPGCERSVIATGLCNMHYLRRAKHGDVRADMPPKRMPRAVERDDIATRILEQCKQVGDCIEWFGYVMPSGYGTISWNSKSWVVHRAMWTAKRGPIPDDDDWTLDHLCVNRRCVNVKHLEVVTRTENSLRGGGLARAHGRARQRSAISCRNGHERNEVNSYINVHGGRVCRVCKNQVRKRSRQRKEGKAQDSASKSRKAN